MSGATVIGENESLDPRNSTVQEVSGQGNVVSLKLFVCLPGLHELLNSISSEDT